MFNTSVLTEAFPVLIQDGMEVLFTTTTDINDILIASKGSTDSFDTDNREEVIMAPDLADDLSEGSPVPPIQDLYIEPVDIFQPPASSHSFYFIAPIITIILYLCSSARDSVLYFIDICKSRYELNRILREQSAQSLIDETYGIGLHCIESWSDCFAPKLIQDDFLTFNIQDEQILSQDMPLPQNDIHLNPNNPIAVKSTWSS